MKRLELIPKKLANPKYIPKPYESMTFLGQCVQIDMKHVPSSCIAGDAAGEKFCQYTAINEFSTYSSAVFLKHMLQAFSFLVKCMQTDKGAEFTKRFGISKSDPKLTMFEKKLASLDIQHQKIRPYTSRHNGKVERSHRKISCSIFYVTV